MICHGKLNPQLVYQLGNKNEFKKLKNSGPHPSPEDYFFKRPHHGPSANELLPPNRNAP
jgi:hypothetical protein